MNTSKERVTVSILLVVIATVSLYYVGFTSVPLESIETKTGSSTYTVTHTMTSVSLYNYYTPQLLTTTEWLQINGFCDVPEYCMYTPATFTVSYVAYGTSSFLHQVTRGYNTTILHTVVETKNTSLPRYAVLGLDRAEFAGLAAFVLVLIVFTIPMLLTYRKNALINREKTRKV